jgi:hypothetical protein
MKIKENTPCFLSKMGHNNFWYPIFSETGLTYITEEIDNPNFKSWTCGNVDLRALIVSPVCLRDVYGDPHSHIVVWIHNKDLKSA